MASISPASRVGPPSSKIKGLPPRIKCACSANTLCAKLCKTRSSSPDLRDKKTSQPISASIVASQQPSINSTSADKDVNIEAVLMDLLVQLNALVVRTRSAETSHDPLTLSAHIKQRAKDDVRSSITSAVNKLTSIRGESDSHLITAYAQTAAATIQALDDTLKSDRVRTKLLEVESNITRERQEAEAAQTSLSRDVAVKDQAIAALISEKTVLETALFKSVRKASDLQTLLEQTLVQNALANQRLIELQLRTLDYKAEIDKRVDRLSSACTGSLGYTPNAFVKELATLRLLKAPCVQGYDASRIARLVNGKPAPPGKMHPFIHQVKGSEARMTREPSDIVLNPWEGVVLQGDRELLLESFQGQEKENSPQVEEMPASTSETVISGGSGGKGIAVDPPSAPSKLLHQLAHYQRISI